ncbi:MAG TPA: hypothetical protein VJP89_13620 [Pyrinomonadaceae bacterium]|nr:hypothetical protein [Pyrinomonadaceae bacterium]
MTLAHTTKLCLGLLVAASVVVAQTSNKSATTSRKANIQVEQDKVAESKANELRQNQLRVLREHVLARILESLKKMDDAGLRMSARNQVLTYLASEKAPSEEKQALTTQIALEGLADLREHGEELTPFMLSYLSSNLGSWIQKYSPNLTEEFEKTVKAQKNVGASQRIRSLFQLENGDVLAAKQIRQELDEQTTLNGLNFWLEELIKRKSGEFEPLASYIVTRAGEGHISFETLFWISDIYLRPQTSEALRKRFLMAVVFRTQPANFAVEPAPQMAYDLLTNILPFVHRSTPELYDQALNQHVAMRAGLTERQRAGEARIKRLRESANPIEDLIAEADATKSKTERNESLLQAAQLALEKARFDLCLDTLDKVDVNVTGDPEPWQRSIDQILKNLVRTVVAGKRAELAERAASRIGSSLTRVEALNLIMRYRVKENDKAEAQRLLTEASKAAAASSDDAQKAKAFFLLSLTCDQVDLSKKAELLLAGVNALNNIAAPDAGVRDNTIYQNYVQRLDNSGYELTKGFSGLTKQDENSALALVERLQKRDLRTFALIGILTGLDQLQND